jgi:hypothetical protein
MNSERQTEREPSQEQMPTQKAVRIETQTNMIHGRLVSIDGSICTIELDTAVSGQFDNDNLVRFDQAALEVDQLINFEYSNDGGESWETRTSDTPLKGIKAWERAGQTVRLDDLADRTVNLEDFMVLIDDAPYRQYPEYDYTSEAYEYAKAHPEEAKCDHSFWNKDPNTGLSNKDPNTGWKIHFTPEIDFVPEVIEYLKANGYYHKYLTGGSPSEGKAFTVYLGSRAMLERQVAALEQTFGKTLLPAMAEDEEEVVPGISARFASFEEDSDGEKLFHQYGKNGMVELMSSVKSRLAQKQFNIDSHTAKKIAEDSYSALSERYGSYFHG